MSTNIQISAAVLETKSTAVINSIPAKIHCDGPAKVSEFFTSYIDKKTFINGDEG